MTPAKKAYYEFKIQADDLHEGLRDPIHDYVSELERDNAELLEALIKINKYSECSDDRFAGYSDTINMESRQAIESATGQPIEEVLK